MGISCKATSHLLSRSSSSETKDVKAGAPLFNHRILGEWHEGNECCCQSFLTVHRLFFKALACLSALWRKGEGWLAGMHSALWIQGQFCTLAHIFSRSGYSHLYMLIWRSLAKLSHPPDREGEKNYHIAKDFPAESHNEIKCKNSAVVYD